MRNHQHDLLLPASIEDLFQVRRLHADYASIRLRVASLQHSPLHRESNLQHDAKPYLRRRP
jgi:hypothetical protein